MVPLSGIVTPTTHSPNRGKNGQRKGKEMETKQETVFATVTLVYDRMVVETTVEILAYDTWGDAIQAAILFLADEYGIKAPYQDAWVIEVTA